ncbi:MAG: hypothetical protein V3T30_00995 [Thermodesulfobacteriota bacterium]
MVHVDEQQTVDTGSTLDSAKVNFTSEQQERVQELIDGAYKRAYSKAVGMKAGGGEVDKLRGEVERLKEHKLSAGIIGAVSRYNVIDSGEVAELIRPHVRMDDDGGLCAASGSGKVAIDEYVAAWLSERPHHLRNSGAVGAGSSGARFGEVKGPQNLTDPTSWRSMPREDFDQLLKEGINVQGSQGQVFRFKDAKNPFHEARKRKFKSRGDR